MAANTGQVGPEDEWLAQLENVDVTLGSEVEPILEQHVEASGGRVRGVRISSGWDSHAKIHNVTPYAGLLTQPQV